MEGSSQCPSGGRGGAGGQGSDSTAQGPGTFLSLGQREWEPGGVPAARTNQHLLPWEAKLQAASCTTMPPPAAPSPSLASPLLPRNTALAGSSGSTVPGRRKVHPYLGTRPAPHQRQHPWRETSHAQRERKLGGPSGGASLQAHEPGSSPPHFSMPPRHPFPLPVPPTLSGNCCAGWAGSASPRLRFLPRRLGPALSAQAPLRSSKRQTTGPCSPLAPPWAAPALLRARGGTLSGGWAAAEF